MPNKVYVINKHGRPLMPCSPAKARHLLDEGKAQSEEEDTLYHPAGLRKQRLHPRSHSGRGRWK